MERERCDLYDAQRRPLGRQLYRGDDVPPGAYYTVAEVWTVNARGELLLTLRHPDKHYAGLWECTGGLVQAGENTLQAALRELREETGIRARPEDLRLLSTQVYADCCFVDSYIQRRNIAPEEIVLQAGETVDAQWVAPDRLDRLVGEGRVVPHIVDRLAAYREQFDRFLAGA